MLYQLKLTNLHSQTRQCWTRRPAAKDQTLNAVALPDTDAAALVQVQTGSYLPIDIQLRLSRRLAEEAGSKGGDPAACSTAAGRR